MVVLAEFRVVIYGSVKSSQKVPVGFRHVDLLILNIIQERLIEGL